MGSLVNTGGSERAGAEMIYGAEACYKHSVELLTELGFPKGVLPLKDLEECGWVPATGFVWMKQKAPFEYYFKGTDTRVSYAAEVTAYVEKGKMKKMTGVKSKQMLLWVPITEMSLVDGGNRIYFKSAVGLGRGFPAAAFADEGEEKQEEEEEEELMVN